MPGKSGGKPSRAKGVLGEREFAAVWSTAGFEVRRLGAGLRGGDLRMTRNGLMLHGEAKRQERPQVSLWVRQVERDAPDGIPWVLGFRASREPWTAVVRLDTFLTLLDGDQLSELLAAAVARAFYVGDGAYVRLPLLELVDRIARGHALAESGEQA